MATEWIIELIQKMNAQHSKVGLINTNDPDRLPQFVSYALADTKNFESVYTYDPIHSLQRLEIDEQGQLVAEAIKLGSDDSDPFAQLGGQKVGLPDVFEFLHEIADVKSLFIINDDPNQMKKELGFYAHDMDLFTKDQFIVFFSAQCEELPETVRELTINIEPPTSTQEERREIIKEVLADFGDKDFSEIHVMATAGLNLTETRSACLDSLYQKGELDMKIISKYKVQAIERSGVLKVLHTEGYGFDQIGGYEVIKNFTRSNLIEPLQFPELATELDMPLPRGVLSFGAGGNGKTLFAKCLGAELGLIAVELLTSNIFSKYQGESGRNLQKALDLIDELSPCLVFIDEFGAMGVRVGTESDGGTRRDVFDRFLSWLGSKERTAIVWATTNTPEQLDPAMRRVGRFDYNIFFPHPDEEARFQILNVHLASLLNVQKPKVSFLRKIANLTEMYSGAEINELVIRAKREVFKARKGSEEKGAIVREEHFMTALDSFSIDKKAVAKQINEYMALAEEMTNDKSFLQDLRKSMKPIASSSDKTKKVVAKKSIKGDN